MVEAGKESGEIRADADAYLFAATFIAQIEGGILLAKTIGDKKYLERSVDGINLLIAQMSTGRDRNDTVIPIPGGLYGTDHN